MSGQLSVTGGAPDRIPERIHARPVPRPWRLVGALVAAVMAAMVVHGLVTNEAFAWGTVWLYLRDVVVIRGIGWTLILTFGSMAIAVGMAVLLAIMRRSDNPVMRVVAWLYIWLFRGTPVYVQLVFWGLLVVLYPQLSIGIPFGPEFLTFDTRTVITAFWAAMFGLAFNEAAYLAEIVRAGLNSVDPGQAEAAKALGMSDSLALRRVILPQAMRVIVPPTGNETISMLKTTSLVIAVPFTLDLFYATNAIGNRLYQPIPLLVIASLWYLGVTSLLMWGQSHLERYFGRGFGTSGQDASPGLAKRVMGRRRARQRAIKEAGTTIDDPFAEVTP